MYSHGRPLCRAHRDLAVYRPSQWNEIAANVGGRDVVLVPLPNGAMQVRTADENRVRLGVVARMDGRMVLDAAQPADESLMHEIAREWFGEGDE